MAACWGNRGGGHNTRYRTAPIHLAKGGRTGGVFSSHREIKREGGVSKGPFSNFTPILGGCIGVPSLKDHFS